MGIAHRETAEMKTLFIAMGFKPIAIKNRNYML